MTISLQALLEKSNIDPRNPEHTSLLRNMQGNILKGHGREHTANIFLQFNNTNLVLLKDFLRGIAKEQVTSCYVQLKEREIFKRNGVPGGLNMFIFFSRVGLEILGTEKTLAPNDDAFNAGMAGRPGINDPVKEKWESGFQKTVHCMLLLADDDERRLCNTAKEIINELVDDKHDNLNPLAEILTVEYGHTIRNANGDGLEHNGYVDGVSQPLFLKDEIESYANFHNLTIDADGSLKQKIDGQLKKPPFDPVFPLKQVLIPDPLAAGLQKIENACGSYFVFRKLEQNVRKFKKDEKLIGKELSANKDERELAGGMLVGRFEDGTPVEVQDDAGLYGSGAFNNFNYDADPSGGRCPHFAHIRKSNPRTADSRSAVMARRGIPFGHRDVSTETDPVPEQTPESGVGLLFMSYQMSLIDQFEVIQKSVNTTPNGTEDIDPIIGQPDSGSNGGNDYRFPLPWNQTELPIKTSEPQSFNNHITMKGGEYFFAPSIAFLQSL